jgi:hypothetical protein
MFYGINRLITTGPYNQVFEFILHFRPIYLKQRFPAFFVCGPEVANGMWLVTLPWKRQSVIFTVNELILTSLLE